MDFRVFTEPQQGASYDDLLHVARAAEELGYGAFFRSDHYLNMGSGDGLPGPSDAWITLAGLARETASIRLGTLVTSATFRLPGPLAIQVATVDAMSGGRVELGLGAGWFEAEHRNHGIAFPPVGERFDRLEEQLEIITGMWATPAGETFSSPGGHYPVTDSPALPKPVQQRVPVIIGGKGPKRTPSLAARFATEFNVPFTLPDDIAVQYERVRKACAEIGRDPREITYSAALTVAVGASDRDVDRRIAATGFEPDALRRDGLVGSADEARETIARYEAAGVERLYVQLLDLEDVDQLEFFAETVVSQVG